MLKRLAFFLVAAAFATGPLNAATDDVGDWVNEGRWPHAKNAVEVTPEKQDAKAERLEKIGDVRQAADQFRRMSDAYPEADEAEEGLVRSARDYLAAGDFTKCRDQLNELRRRYANPAYLDAIGEVEISLARGFLEGKGEGGTYRLASRIRKAQAIFQRQFDQDPQGRWADDALFGLGNCQQTLKDYDGAIKKYKEMLDKYPRSELRAQVEASIAVCINKREPLPDYSEAESTETVKLIKRAKDDASSGDDTDLDVGLLEEQEKVLAERQAQKRYDQALFYVKNKHFRAAEVYLELLKDRYPDSPWAGKAKKTLDELRKR